LHAIQNDPMELSTNGKTKYSNENSWLQLTVRCKICIPYIYVYVFMTGNKVISLEFAFVQLFWPCSYSDAAEVLF
jgi:hypothetical protein